MPVALGRRLVQAPPFAPARYGLWSVVDQPIDSDAHWQAGVDFQPTPCNEAHAVLDNCPTGDELIKTATASGLDVVGAQPFTVYSWIDCSVTGFYDEADMRTTSHLTNGEARAVERAFWTGVVEAPGGPGTVYPHLAANAMVVEAVSLTTLQTAATVITGTYDVVEGLGRLEGALSECYGGEGVIHVPSSALAHLVAWGLVVKDGERLRTFYGNRVAVYSSNNRTGPDGTTPASNGWFYATGSITGRRSDAKPIGTVRQAVNKAKNSLVQLAERTYVIGWDCCHLAVQVSLGGVVTGTAAAAT